MGLDFVRSPHSPSRAFSKNALFFFHKRSDFWCWGYQGRRRPSPESSLNSWFFHFCCVFAKLVSFSDAGGCILRIDFSFCLYTFVIFSMFLKGCGPLVLLSLRAPTLILRNLRAFFRGSGVFAFLSGIRIFATRLGSIRSSWVGMFLRVECWYDIVWVA